MTPSLFFALIANVPAGEIVDGQRMARPQAIHRKKGEES
jgi:hypothetical protein